MSTTITSPTSTTCADCAADLDHCHEVLVQHLDGRWDCADAECDGWWERHEFRVYCDELSPACTCGYEPARRPLALAA